MDITFGLWHILILTAALGLALTLAANAKLLWNHRRDTAITIGIILMVLSALSSISYGLYRRSARLDIESQEHRRIAAEARQEARLRYLPGIWSNVFDAVDEVYGWESKWAIIEAVPVRYGIADIHTLPGQGFSMILREFYGEPEVKLAVRELLRPYITPFPDPEITLIEEIETNFGELLVVPRKEAE